MINQYSGKLMVEVGKKYNDGNLRYMRQFYEMIEETKGSPLGTKLSISHIRQLFSLTNNNIIGIIIYKKENKFVIEYCSDDRIAVREYELV